MLGMSAVGCVVWCTVCDVVNWNTLHLRGQCHLSCVFPHLSVSVSCLEESAVIFIIVWSK